jgi:hypothetical protein
MTTAATIRILSGTSGFSQNLLAQSLPSLSNLANFNQITCQMTASMYRVPHNDLTEKKLTRFTTAATTRILSGTSGFSPMIKALFSINALPCVSEYIKKLVTAGTISSFKNLLIFFNFIFNRQCLACGDKFFSAGTIW